MYIFLKEFVITWTRRANWQRGCMRNSRESFLIHEREWLIGVECEWQQWRRDATVIVSWKTSLIHSLREREREKRRLSTSHIVSRSQRKRCKNIYKRHQRRVVPIICKAFANSTQKDDARRFRANPYACHSNTLTYSVYFLAVIRVFFRN